MPQRRVMLERGLQKFLEQIICSSYFLSEFSAVWLAHVFWEHGVVGSNPAIPMPNVMYIFLYVLPFRLNNLNKVVES